MDRIDEWLETPMFEPDPDEKWEEMATSARAPLRLAAALRLRMTARAASRRSPGLHFPSMPGAPQTGAERPGEVSPAASPPAEPVREAAVAGLRKRLNTALDRWAAAEVEAGARLERLLLPKRWHDVATGPAGGPVLDEGTSKLQLHHRV